MLFVSVFDIVNPFLLLLSEKIETRMLMRMVV